MSSVVMLTLMLSGCSGLLIDEGRRDDNDGGDTKSCYPPRAACDDGNPCTTEDTCDSHGKCVGTPVVCNQPPRDRCVGGDHLRQYESLGFCNPASGDCIYDYSDSPCGMDSECEGDICVSYDIIEERLTSYVDARIGARRAQGVPSRDGNQTVSAVAPFGMIQIGPDNEHLSDDRFAGLHLGIAAGNGAQYGMGFGGKTLPVATSLATGLPDFETPGTVVWDHELAQPGYLRGRVTHQGNVLTVEMVSRPRYAMVRLTRSVAGPMAIYMPRATMVSPTRMDGNESYRGSHDCGPFYFSMRPEAAALSHHAKGLGYASRTRLVYMVGVSSVSSAGAAANLPVETPDFDLERAAARSDWGRELRRIRIAPDTSHELKVKFYTTFYRCLMYPQIYSDKDRRYARFGSERADIDSLPADWDYYYTHFSGWDTYRVHTPLMALMYPHIASEQARSLLTDARVDGRVPKWKLWGHDDAHMTGNPGAMIIAWSYLLGANGFVLEQPLDLERLRNRTAPNPHPQRPSPEIDHGAANFVLARLGEHLGATKYAAEEWERSRRWWALWNSDAPEAAGAVGGIRPRDDALEWKLSGSYGYGDNADYVEAGQADTQWLAHWDLAELVSLMGGTAAARARLAGYFWDESLSRSLCFLRYHDQFSLYNQPVYSIPWTWGQIGAPDRQVDEVHRILHEDFLNEVGSGALPGNDDLGSTSAWFVWSALGLYPFWPGVPVLTINTPVFAKATLLLGAKTLTISRQGDGDYITGVTVNDTPLFTTWVSLGDLLALDDNHLVISTGPTATWGMETTPPNWRSRELGEMNAKPGLLAPTVVRLAPGELSPEFDVLVHDLETPAADLTLDAVSSNHDLIAADGLLLSGNHHRRRLRIQARVGVSGTCTVTLMLSDGVNVTTALITVVIEA